MDPYIYPEKQQKSKQECRHRATSEKMTDN